MFKILIRKLFWGILRHIISDRQYAQVRFWLEFDRFPDLKNPTTFNEKIQFIKLYQRFKVRKTAANRIEARSYIAGKTDEKYLVPLIGIYDRLTESDWRKLPSRFVLKANHGCGMVEIVRDKKQKNFNRVSEEITKWQNTDYYKFGREWVYKDLPRSILIEKLLLNTNGEPPKDYKFFCFHGTVELIQIDFERHSDQRRNIYDRNLNLLPCKILYDNYTGNVTKPKNLTEAIELSEMLSSEFNFLRVDLYLIQNDIYVGELTNYPGNGFAKIKPESFDKYLGEKLHLNAHE